MRFVFIDEGTVGFNDVRVTQAWLDVTLGAALLNS
jgi:hypothetical protein